MKMIKRIVKNILTTKPPMLNEKYKILIKQLKNNVFDIDLPSNPTQSEKEWLANRVELVSKITNDDPLKFLQWGIIKRTMVAAYPQKFVKKELGYLKMLPDWDGRWKNALRESRIGSPTKYPFYLNSSGNLIHQAYHISQFEKYSKKHIDEYDLIFEFGGGYGAMCKIIHKLGFKGKYIIFDLPEFSALQKFYLTANRLITSELGDGNTDNHNIINISQLEPKVTDLLNKTVVKKSLFIANWSLSESPIAVRNIISQNLSRINGVMLAYQENFGEMDNVNYFYNFKGNFPGIDNWNDIHMPYMPKNHYLFGYK